MRVCPPTRTTSLICATVMPASAIAFLHGSNDRSSRSPTSCSSLARVSFRTRCFGPVASAVTNGKLISVSMVVDNSILAFSAASFSRCSAISLPLEAKSRPCSCLNSEISHSTIRWSRLSPPRCVSPLVDFTSITPSPTSRIDTSNVPPPKSYTAIVSSFFLSSP